MEKALLLHGWGGQANENWFPWLKTQLDRKLFDVYTPNLPSSDTPILEEQLEYLVAYSTDFEAGQLIVGHSLGSQLALKFIEENDIRNTTVVLVAPTYPCLAEELGEEVLGENYQMIEKYYNTEIDFEKINTLNNKYIVFLSDNDPYIDLENAKKYYSELKNIEFRELENKGHFNESAGISELPEILEYL